MPPAADSHYFPALDKCLAGDARLISWNTARRALCDESTAVENTRLEHFFTDNETVAALSNALDPFHKPTAKSASDFDTKTAPIHVSQTPNGDYNLDELKKDAKWLSGEVKIEELAALRIAIVEWQDRASDQLLLTAMNGPNAASVDKDLAKSSFGTSVSAPGLSPRPALDFTKEEVRRRRLLDAYLSEKEDLLKVIANLVGRSAVSKNEIQTHDIGSLREHARKTWIDSVASRVRQGASANADAPEDATSSLNCIQKISSILRHVEDSTAWPKAFTENDATALSYLNSQFVELVQILRLLLSNLYALDGVPDAATVHAWFLAMEGCDFLRETKPFFPVMDESQLLVSVISVEILKPQLVTGEIMRSAGIDTPGLTGDFYIKDDKCIKAVNDLLQKSVNTQNRIAAPAIYAWSIITFIIRDIALIHREVWESRLESAPDSPRETRRGSRGPRSDIESLYWDTIVVREWEPLPHGTPGSFAAAAVDRMKVFGLITLLNDTASTLYNTASDSDTAFICKEGLLDLVREGLPFVQYDVPVLDAVLSVLTPTGRDTPSQTHVGVLASKLLYDMEQSRPMIIDAALARYPYELSPLLRLFTTLAHAESRRAATTGLPEVVEILDNLTSYTQSVPVGFKDFHLINEELNENDIVLTAALPLFVSRDESISQSNARLLGNGQELVVHDGEARLVTAPAGAIGRIIKESHPMVLKLQHAHSGLEYLGLLLSTLLPGTCLVPFVPGAELDLFTAAEIVALFTTLLTATLKQQQGVDEASAVIATLSRGLREEQDIVLVVTELLETELLTNSDQRAQEGSYELVTACAEFLGVLVRISPERVWSHLARSSLLGVADGAATVVAVVNGTEVQLGRFRFLHACVKLHASLLEDAIAGLVKRKAQSPRTGNRFAMSVEPLDSTSERIMTSVLNAYQKILLNVFRHLPEVKFEFQDERLSINHRIMESFSTLLRTTYGVNISKDPASRLTNVLAPAAAALLSACDSTSSTNSLVNALARVLSDALAVAENALPDLLRSLLIRQSRTACRLLTLILRATKSGIDLSATVHERNKTIVTADMASAIQTKHAASKTHTAAHKRAISLSSELLHSMPLFGSLLACDHALKDGLYALLTELVGIVGSGDEDPPSLLAQFDLEAQKSLLLVVTQLDRPICDVDVERRAWDFLSTVLSSRQHWFAVYLLTGELPKQRAQRGKPETIKTKSILNYALDQLSHISLLAPERAIGMLKFVATAQQTWVWATTTLQSHSDFIKNTLAWIDTLGPAAREPSPGSSIICAKECVMASLLCDIFAVNVHASMETGDMALTKSLTQKLSFLREHGVTVNAYNRSLHKNLADNLRRKYPYSDLSDFQRTEVNPDAYGTEYLYDREFASDVLGHDVAWYGPARTRVQGFSDEFARANANLSLLDGQTKLLRSWKTLATTLCECAGHDAALQTELAKVVEKCLLANVNPQLDEPGIADVLDMRLEMAFVTISRLVSLKVQGGAMQALLPAAWELVRTSPVDYDVATAQGDIRYYRELLQVLYLSIQPHIYQSQDSTAQPGEETPHEYLAPAVASILVSIIGKVVAPGFRALCGNLHSDVDLALPADFALITALLQGVLSVRGISSVYTQLSDLVAGSSIVRGALSLYSWADQLSEVTGQDPMYGEVAIMFLLALSSVRPVAEQMALDGVLTNLASGNLSNYLRKPGGKGPFDSPQRMFVIWTEGFLPLCLNLLDSVGPPIAAEVAVFLNSFPDQLRRAERSLQNEPPSVRNPKAGSITLSLISEAHSLTMISKILSSDAARGAAEGVAAIPALDLDEGAVQTLTETLTRSKRSLHDRLVAVNALEEKWLKTPINITGDNLLKAKVVKELESMAKYLGSSDQ